MNTVSYWDQWVAYEAKTESLKGVLALLEWDEQTLMPEAAAPVRGEQQAMLAGFLHARRTHTDRLELLKTLENEPLAALQKKDIASAKRDYDHAVALPEAFVEAFSRASSDGFHAWKHAKKQNDFAHFAPALERLIALAQEEARLLYPHLEPYEALMQKYERGISLAQTKVVLDDLRSWLVEKIPAWTTPKDQAEALRKAAFYGDFSRNEAQKLCQNLAEYVGYDPLQGASGLAPHPFMTTIGAHDQRISTRLKDDDLSYGVWASIHEAGHAMYEQGLDVNFWGLGRAKSLGMVLHESQSRLWENIIGRSESFWQGAWETCKDTVPGHFKGITPQTWTAASNIIEPSLVRVAADEVTYHLHIIIRFELEHALITGDLKVSDLPAAWNSKYKEYLHIDVPDDSRGCLQDIHWASGLFGYFPTYSLGSLVSSQVYSQAQKDLPLLAMGLSQDACKALLGYLKQHLYASGDHLTTDEILMKLTGNRLSAEAFKAYLNDKYGS